MEDEIANRAFAYPSSELARMLSPKRLKPDIKATKELPLLHQYDFMVDTRSFQDALDDAVAQLGTFTPPAAGEDKSASHLGLAEFLTKCVRACHNALDGRKDFTTHQERWYRDLEFAVRKPVVDGIEGAASLYPDVMGGKGISAIQEQLYWNPPPDKLTRRITLPVEVEEAWRTMISQAATYASCLYGANPMRTFTLTLAFNQENNTLRFLVFHRGGLTASEEYSITVPSGLEEITRLFLTLMLWRTVEEAGFIACCNNTTYLLPGNQEGMSYVSATVDATLSPRHLCICGKMTFVSCLLSTNDPSVVPKYPGKKSPKPLIELSSSLGYSVVRATLPPSTLFAD